MINNFENSLNNHISAVASLKQQKEVIDKSIKLITKNLKKGGKILLCGNGGSAADAQHLAAEFLVRLNPKKNRPSIPAISLATDISTVTACSNDYNFDKIYQRTFEGLVKQNDILIILSTSGKSKNILNVLKSAKRKKIPSIGFLGNSGGLAKSLCSLSIIVPSSNTAIIQECHIFIGHFMFNEIEKNLFY